MALRREVLDVYGRIMRTAFQWVAIDPSRTSEERNYIRTEARELFKQNKYVSTAKDMINPVLNKIRLRSHVCN